MTLKTNLHIHMHIAFPLDSEIKCIVATNFLSDFVSTEMCCNELLRMLSSSNI